MYVSILGTHPKCGENAIVTAKLGEELYPGFVAKRVLAVAPSQIEAVMQGNAAVDEMHQAATAEA